jgi:hypothetical protein
MHLIYIEDSADERLAIFTALAIPVEQWRICFGMVRDFRRGLKQAHGIYIYKELHAWKFVSGRGRIAPNIVAKGQRAAIFRQALQLMTTLPGAQILNACFPKGQMDRAFERLLNRIERSLVAWGSHGILLCDQGKEGDYTRLVRRMNVYNPIPSQYGTWAVTGSSWRNIPLERIVEDPVFKRSDKSYFIQLVDFAAYSLLRRERPTSKIRQLGLHNAFDILQPILLTAATRNDPEGILRP